MILRVPESNCVWGTSGTDVSPGFGDLVHSRIGHVSTVLWLLVQISIPILAGIGFKARGRGLGITLAWSAVPICWILVAVYRNDFAVEEVDPSRVFLTGFIIATAIYLVISNVLCWKLGRWIGDFGRANFRERDAVVNGAGEGVPDEPAEFPLGDPAIALGVEESSRIETP